MKKRLVIATDCFLPRWDGISRFLHEMIPDLQKVWDVVVIAPNFPGKPISYDGVQILRVPLSMIKIGDYPVARTSKKTIVSALENADLLWVHSISSIGRQAIKTAKSMDIPVIMQIHSIDYELLAKSINAGPVIQDSVYYLSKHYLTHYYSMVDLIITPSENVDEMLEWNEIKTPRVRINMGVNSKKFVPAEDKEKAKLKLGINSETTILGYCGRLAEEKNLGTFLEAFRRIKGEFPNAKILVVGSGLKKIEREMKNDERVIYVGEQDNVIPYLQAMDIFVLPSLTETTSLATLEAMACEVVPVATPVGYVKDYIEEKKNGLLFPIRNSTVLSLKLKWLLQEPYVRKKMGKDARKLVVDKFSWDGTIAQTIKILKSMERSDVSVDLDKPVQKEKSPEAKFSKIQVDEDLFDEKETQ